MYKSHHSEERSLFGLTLRSGTGRMPRLKCVKKMLRRYTTATSFQCIVLRKVHLLTATVNQVIHSTVLNTTELSNLSHEPKKERNRTKPSNLSPNDCWSSTLHLKFSIPKMATPIISFLPTAPSYSDSPVSKLVRSQFHYGYWLYI